MKLNKLDLELIDRAAKIIKDRFQQGSINHTVGCALRDKQGNIFVGVNLDMDGMHSVCGEQVAFGNALTQGVKEFDTIVAVGYTGKDVKVIAPCGSCRQFMSKYAPDINVIIENDGKLTKVKFDDILPYAYKLHLKRS